MIERDVLQHIENIIASGEQKAINQKITPKNSGILTMSGERKTWDELADIISNEVVATEYVISPQSATPLTEEYVYSLLDTQKSPTQKFDVFRKNEIKPPETDEELEAAFQLVDVWFTKEGDAYAESLRKNGDHVDTAATFALRRARGVAELLRWADQSPNDDVKNRLKERLLLTAGFMWVSDYDFIESHTKGQKVNGIGAAAYYGVAGVRGAITQTFLQKHFEEPVPVLGRDQDYKVNFYSPGLKFYRDTLQRYHPNMVKYKEVADRSMNGIMGQIIAARSLAGFLETTSSSLQFHVSDAKADTSKAYDMYITDKNGKKVAIIEVKCRPGDPIVMIDDYPLIIQPDADGTLRMASHMFKSRTLEEAFTLQPQSEKAETMRNVIESERVPDRFLQTVQEERVIGISLRISSQNMNVFIDDMDTSVSGSKFWNIEERDVHRYSDNLQHNDIGLLLQLIDAEQTETHSSE